MYSRHGHALQFYLLLLGSLIVVLLFFSLSARTANAASPHIDVMTLHTEIDPASLSFLKKAIITAEGDGAQALVIEINTPGGDLTSMKSMTEEELNSTVPIVTYVSPTGAYAASAGAFVTLAAPIAAMAPTTRIGASSPILSTGSNLDSTLQAKLEQDLMASMRGIQNRYHRSGVDLAVRMVTNAASYDATEAVKDDIVDLEATSLSNLLNQVNGKQIKLNSGSVTLH